jgi:hypothetical protein
MSLAGHSPQPHDNNEIMIKHTKSVGRICVVLTIIFVTGGRQIEMNLMVFTPQKFTYT